MQLAPFARRVAPYVPLVVVTGALAWFAIHGVLDTTGGLPALPLDDSFIHMQYARAFAELHPFSYTRGAERAAGMTSLVWPLSLAPFWALGLRGTALIWVTWLFGFVALGMLAHETARAARRIVSPENALASGAMVLAFGGYVWFAASGMEVVPLAVWLMRTARRAAEFAEADPEQRNRRRSIELVVLGLLGPSLRPEAALASLIAAATLARFDSGRRRALGIAALSGVAIPPIVYFIGTGSPATTTAIVKWLPLSPYYDVGRVLHAMLDNTGVLFGTLLDGRVWSSVFLPSGGRVVVWAALPALVVAGFVRRVHFRTAALVLVGIGILIPTSYDSFLWNRLRYLWPFAAPWFIGLAALSDGVGALFARVRAELVLVRVLVAGGFVGALAGHLSFTFEDLAVSADAIRRQQADIGRWAHDALPSNALIGVNDTGAIAYYSERRIFDVVGLTTAGEARYWAAGAGSRFEHYERLDRSRLPTHFIVYPEWFALSPLLGKYLTERYVPNATILGGTSKVAHEADWSELGSGALPKDTTKLGRMIDELDVADLDSEHDHAYRLFWATQTEDSIIESDDDRVDGSRSARTLDRFELELRPGGTLVARLGSEGMVTLTVRAAGRELGRFALRDGEWQETSLKLPADLGPGKMIVEIEPPHGKTFTAAHYWSFE